jgi:hypothetical protein
VAQLVNKAYIDKVEPFVTHLHSVCTPAICLLTTVSVRYGFNVKVMVSNLLQGLTSCHHLYMVSTIY